MTHAVVAACPHCGARVAISSTGPTWCSLCFADLSPTPVVAAPAVASAAPAVAPAAPAVAPAAPAVAPAVPAVAPADPAGSPDPASCWPCLSCGATSPWDESVCRGCGLGFLAQVREAEPPLLVLPVVGDLSGRLGRLSRTGRVVAGGAALSAMALLPVLLSLVGR